MLNTITTETLAGILLRYPGMHVAILSQPGDQIKALWEEHVHVQYLNVFNNNDGDETGFSGPVLLLDFYGPELRVIK